VHLALVRGRLEGVDPLVRVHPIDTLSDLVGLRDPGRTWTLRDAMKRIAAEGTGVVIVLRDHASPRELADAVAALSEKAGQKAVPKSGRSGVGTGGQQPAQAPQVLRTYGVGAQILKDLGVTRMRVLSAPKQLQGISAFGLEITGYLAE
jgi:3,4-dihydroxy 2-butanone 4-phosphate synthase / GTP cyclohydrolase II